MAFKGLRFAAAEIRHASAGAVMKVVMAAISVIPLLYGGLYLTAFLDPYENLDTVPVAVVNEDTGAEVDGEWRVVGDDVVEKLEENHDGLGWQFVSAEEAQSGLEKGTYYMTCTIPENFTEMIASADSDAPEKAALVIDYNETQNMLASQIGGTVWKEVRTQVSDTVAEEYWNTVFDRVNDGSDQLQEAVDGANELHDGLTDAHDGSSEITENLGTLSDGANDLDKGLGTLSDGASTLKDGTSSLASGANKLKDGADQLSDGAATLANGTTTLSDGADSLKDGLKKLVNGAKTLSTGTGSLSDGADSLSTGLKTLSSGADTLSEGTASLSSGADTLSKGTASLSSGADTLSEGTASLSSGADSLSSGAAQLKKEGTQALADGAAQLASQTAALPDESTVATAEAGAKQISSGFTSLKEGLATLKGDASSGTGLAYAAAGANQLSKALADTSALDDGIEAIQEGVSGDTNSIEYFLDKASDASSLQEAKTYIGYAQAALNKVDAGLTKLENTADASLEDASDKAGLIASGLDDAVAGIGAASSTNTETLYGGVNVLSAGYESFSSQVLPLVEGAPTLKAAIATINSGASTVNSKMGELATGASTLASGASTVNAGAKSLASGASTVNAGASSLASGASKVNSGASSLASGAKSAKAGAETLASGASKLDSGASTLADGTATASSGANSLASGAKKLDSGAAELADGIGTAVDGTTQLADGAAKVDDGAKQLADGTVTAKDGSAKIADGAVKLRDGSQELTDGLVDAVDGSGELADGLADGADELRVDDSEAKAEVMSAPVELDEEYFTTVKNYGTGFAPYFISLGLWVGALMAGFVLKPLNRRLVLSGGSPMMAAFSSFMPLALMSVVQALLLLVTLQFGLQLQIDNVGGYYAFGILTALAFAAFMQFLMAAFGFPGKFIAIILLMLQLTSAAGTFPIEQTPEFFQIMNPFMPMTYVVSGMRQVMTGVNYDTVASCVAVIAGIGIVSFLLTSLVARAKRTVRMEDLHPILQLG